MRSLSKKDGVPIIYPGKNFQCKSVVAHTCPPFLFFPNSSLFLLSRWFWSKGKGYFVTFYILPSLQAREMSSFLRLALVFLIWFNFLNVDKLFFFFFPAFLEVKLFFRYCKEKMKQKLKMATLEIEGIQQSLKLVKHP